MLQKLVFKCLGLYQISDTVKDKSTYILEELDGSQLADTFAGNRLKKFHLWQQLQLDYTLNLDHEEISTFGDFFAGNNDSNLSDTPDNFIFWYAPGISEYLNWAKICWYGKFFFLIYFSLRVSLLFVVCFLGIIRQHLSRRGRMWWGKKCMLRNK